MVITGGPRTGKTSYAGRDPSLAGIPVLHTDDLNQTHGWSEASEAVSTWFDRPGSWIVEGVTVPRAARKWLKRNPSGRPFDVLVFLPTPHVALTAGQATMGKGVLAVLREILPELQRRGVKTIKGGDA